MASATNFTNTACVGLIGLGLTSSFAGGAIGDYLGNYTISQIDNTYFDKKIALLSAFFAGTMNLFAGFGSGSVTIVGQSVSKAISSSNSMLAARIVSTMLIVGTEAICDSISFLIRKDFL